MLKKRLSFTLSLLVDLIDADLLVPGRDGKMFAGGGETKIGDTVLGRRVERDILGDIAGGIGLSC